MRFLIDADLPRRAAGLLKTYGHESADVPACPATADRILRLLESLLRQADLVGRLPGRLAIVEWGAVRLRPKS